MARLTAPNGAVVNVNDGKAEVLRQLGYKPVKAAEEPKKAPAKKSAPSKPEQ